MPKTTSKHFGQLPPRYGFMLNPYPDHRVSRCPLCEGKTGQRKIPLIIHIEPMHMIVLNYTCRFCQACDLVEIVLAMAVNNLIVLTSTEKLFLVYPSL